MYDIRASLDPHLLRQNAKLLNLEEDRLQAILEEATQILEDPYLLQQVDTMRVAIFEDGYDGKVELPGGAPTYYLAFILLAQLPYLEDIYKRNHIGHDVLADTLHDFGLWVSHNHRHGFGFPFREFQWLTAHFSGKLFCLGRLHYLLTKGNAPALAYRSRTTGKTVLLASEGKEYKVSGWAQDTFGIHEDNAWIAHIKEEEDSITGHPLLPDGRAQTGTVTLDKTEFENVYKPGDWVIEMHIPTGSPLSPEACQASIAWAPQFFARYFPEIAPVAFQCSSWLLGPCLEEMLPEKSGIIQFARRFHRINEEGQNEGQFWERVFDYWPVTPETAPRNTSLQRAFLDRREAGLPICTSTGIILL